MSTATQVKQDVRGFLLLYMVMTLWASAFVGIREGLNYFTPGSLALLRFIVASLCITVMYLRLPKQKHRPTLKETLQMMILGAVGLGLYNITLNTGEVTLSSATASFIIGQIPVFATGFAIIFLREKLPSYGWLGMLISFTGILLIALTDHQGTTQEKITLGALYTLIAAISGALYAVLQKPLLKKFHPFHFSAYAFWGATLLLSIYTPQLWHELPHAKQIGIASTIYLGIFPSAIAFAAWSYSLARMPACHAAIFLYLIPVITLLLGWLVLNELPTSWDITGGLLILAGAWQLQHQTKKNLSQ